MKILFSKKQADDISNQVTDKMERQILAIENIAKSSDAIATVAKEKAKQADIKGWISILISVLCLIIEFIVNHEKILSYFNL